MQSLANFITTFGLLLIFNAACIAILGFMTEFGHHQRDHGEVERAAVARPHVTADEADTFGLQVPRGRDRGLGRRLRLDEGVGRERLTLAARRLGRCGLRRTASRGCRAAHRRVRAAPRPAAGAGRGAGRRRIRPPRSTSATRSRRSAEPGAAPSSSGWTSRRHRWPTRWRSSRTLNADEAIDAILVQSPLPGGMGADAEQRVFDAIDPAKDVDGFHPDNVGLLVQKRPRAGGVHAARLHRAARARGHSAARASTPSSSAAATSSASRWRCCCCIAMRPSPSATRGRPDLPTVARIGGHPGRGDRPARLRDARLRQAGRDRDRRRHQHPDDRGRGRPPVPGGQPQARAVCREGQRAGRRRASRGRRGGRRADAGAGRRRPADHCDGAAQHRHGGGDSESA